MKTMSYKRGWVTGSLRQAVTAIVWKLALILNAPPKTAQPKWVEVKSGPIKKCCLFLDSRDGSSLEMCEGTYDAFMYNIIQQIGLLQAGNQVWDVGAHFGYHSLVLATFVQPLGRVYAFEPNPFVAAHFRQHMDRNPFLAKNIELRQYALSNSSGEQILRCSSSYFLSSIGYLQNNSIPSERVSKSTYDTLDEVSVSTITADMLLENGLEPPVLIKIDVEGAEVNVIDGAKQLLSNFEITS